MCTTGPQWNLTVVFASLVVLIFKFFSVVTPDVWGGPVDDQASTSSSEMARLEDVQPPGTSLIHQCAFSFFSFQYHCANSLWLSYGFYVPGCASSKLYSTFLFSDNCFSLHFRFRLICFIFIWFTGFLRACIFIACCACFHTLLLKQLSHIVGFLSDNTSLSTC